jgi:hypothetical protein
MFFSDTSSFQDTIKNVSWLDPRITLSTNNRQDKDPLDNTYYYL